MGGEPLANPGGAVRSAGAWPRAESRARLAVSSPGPDVAVLEVAGEIDIVESEAILDRLLQLLREPAARLVVLDLSGVRFMGSHALSAVVHAQRVAAELGRTLRGVTGSANRAVVRPVTMTGLDWVIEWFPELAEATGGAAGRPDPRG